MTTGVPALDRAIAKLMESDQESVVALLEIAEERVRQIEKEGWTPEHDNGHRIGDMTTAAASYAAAERFPEYATAMWPWDREWWKPSSPHRNRVKAGALLVADLARHFRSAPKTA